MSDTPVTAPYVVEDCRGALHVYSDGSITRSIPSIFNTAVPSDGSVLSKQLLFNSTHNLPLRVYKPNTSSATTTKLPVLIFIHGGGFCIGSCTWSIFHRCCLALASALQAVVVAPDYRLAPEHRLPAAVEDGLEALMWVREQALCQNRDEWWADVADFGRVFLCGESAGGNITDHLMVRIGAGLVELGDVRVPGFVLVAPFFGGTVRTRSEVEGDVETFLSLEQIDRYWRLSIPVGETMDHPLVNPFGPVSPSLESVSLGPILVACGSKDLLKDRNEDYVRRLKDWGKKIEYREFEGEQHGFFSFDPHSEGSTKLMQVIKNFIAENSN